jgi:hypothetical protein
LTPIIDCEGRKYLPALIRDGDFQGAPPLAVALDLLGNFRLSQSSQQQLAPFELCFLILDQFNTSKTLDRAAARFKVAKFELRWGLHLLWEVIPSKWLDIEK